MPLPVITDTARCAVRAHIGTHHLVSVVHVTGVTGQTPAAVGLAVGTAWGDADNIGNVQGNNITYDGVDVLYLDGTSATRVGDPSDFLVSGGSASGTCAPIQVAAILTWNTGIGGRSNRGRTYVPGPDASGLDSPETQWKSDFVISLSEAANNFVAGLLAGTPALTLVVASYKLASARPVVVGVGRQYLGTQRRRAAA